MAVGQIRLKEEDLASDVGVDPDQLEGCRRPDALGRIGGGPAGQAEPELRVLLAGPDELVGVSLDAGRHAQEDTRRRRSGSGSKRLESVEFVEGIDDDAPDPGAGSKLQFGFALVVAGKDEA